MPTIGADDEPEEVATQMADGLSDAVRAALAASGLSVQQVSAETRIRSAIVEDLAAGRTASSGGDVYVRGHLRAIAHATGTDAEALVRAYEQATGASLDHPDLEHVVHLHGHTVGSLGLPLAEPPERRGPRWGVAVAAAGLVLAGLVVVGSLSGEDQPADTISAAAGAPAPPPAATTPPAAPRLPAVVRPTGAALRVAVAGGSSWVQVRTPTGTLFEGVLDAGAVKTFQDRAELSVRVGNAGAVSLTCGGRDLPAGTDGQVRSFSCASGGLSPV